MRTGEKIAKSLGISHLKHAQIVQFLTSPVRTLVVVYDTFRTRVPITHYFLKHFPYPFTALDNLGWDREDMLPPIELLEYNGDTNTKILFSVDLAGRLADEDEFQKRWESAHSELRLNRLDEAGFTIPSFKSDGVSSRNRDFYQIRKSQGSSGSKLTSVSWNKRKDTLTLQYKVTPTYDSKVGVTTKGWSAGSTGRYSDPPYAKTARTYKVQIQFEDVSKHIGTRSEFLDLLIEWEKEEFIRALIRDCPVRVHSNDKSFYFQGVWENGDELDFAIHPFPGTKGQGEWSQKHVGEYPGVYITKHILEVFEQIPQDTDKIMERIERKYS